MQPQSSFERGSGEASRLMPASSGCALRSKSHASLYQRVSSLPWRSVCASAGARPLDVDAAASFDDLEGDLNDFDSAEVHTVNTPDLDDLLTCASDSDLVGESASALGPSGASTRPVGCKLTRKQRLLQACEGQRAYTPEGYLQLAAQRAVLKNEFMRLHLLAEQYGAAGKFSPLLSSSLLALGLQEGCTPRTLDALLALGGDPRQHILLRTRDGEPAAAVLPLAYAVERHDVEVVACLLQHGADPLQADAKGSVPFIEALKSSGHPSAGPLVRALYDAAKRLHGDASARALVMRYRRTLSSAALVIRSAGGGGGSVRSGGKRSEAGLSDAMGGSSPLGLWSVHADSGFGERTCRDLGAAAAAAAVAAPDSAESPVGLESCALRESAESAPSSK
jgi:hypothetical protein